MSIETVTTRKRRLPGSRRVVDHYDKTFTARLAFIRTSEFAQRRRAQELADIRARWEADAEAVCAPFGLDWRTLDPLAVDVLSYIEPVGASHWQWTGRTNNKGLPVMRNRGLMMGTKNTEWSAHRMLHRLLAGDHEPPKVMRATCSADFLCVHLAHRCPTCRDRGTESEC